MPDISLMIHGRSYDLHCDRGEEEELRWLAESFDRRLRELEERLGDVGEARLLVVAGLVLTEGLHEERRQRLALESRGKLEDLAAESGLPRLSGGLSLASAERPRLDHFWDCVRRCHRIADRLESWISGSSPAGDSPAATAAVALEEAPADIPLPFPRSS